MRISTNVVAINSKAKLDRNISDLDKENRKLSTGDRIAQTAYDPTGLSISEGMKARIRSFSQAERNAGDSISLIQVAEGALGGIQQMATRMKELALQSANDTLGNEDRGYVNGEYQNMKREIRRILASTNFNGRKVLSTSAGNYQFQVGIHGQGPGEQISYDMSKVIKNADRLSASGSSISTKLNSQNAIDEVNGMISEINSARAWLGATQTRVAATIQNLNISRENAAAANSRIRDTDIAESAAARAVAQIKTNASTASLAQAKNLPGQATRLLE